MQSARLTRLIQSLLTVPVAALVLSGCGSDEPSVNSPGGSLSSQATVSSAVSSTPASSASSIAQTSSSTSTSSSSSSANNGSLTTECTTGDLDRQHACVNYLFASALQQLVTLGHYTRENFRLMADGTNNIGRQTSILFQSPEQSALSGTAIGTDTLSCTKAGTFRAGAQTAIKLNDGLSNTLEDFKKTVSNSALSLVFDNCQESVKKPTDLSPEARVENTYNGAWQLKLSTTPNAEQTAFQGVLKFIFKSNYFIRAATELNASKFPNTEINFGLESQDARRFNLSVNAERFEVNGVNSFTDFIETPDNRPFNNRIRLSFSGTGDATIKAGALTDLSLETYSFSPKITLIDESLGTREFVFAAATPFSFSGDSDSNLPGPIAGSLTLQINNQTQQMRVSRLNDETGIEIESRINDSRQVAFCPWGELDNAIHCVQIE